MNIDMDSSMYVKGNIFVIFNKVLNYYAPALS